MSTEKVYPIPTDLAANCHIDEQTYLSMYQQSISSPDEFWAEQANQFVEWYSPWTTVSSEDFVGANIKWFEGATLNVSYNCLDRHIAQRGDQTAIICTGITGDGWTLDLYDYSTRTAPNCYLCHHFIDACGT